MHKGQCFSPSFKLSTFQSKYLLTFTAEVFLAIRHARTKKKLHILQSFSSLSSISLPVGECGLQMMQVILADFANVGRWGTMTHGNDYIWQSLQWLHLAIHQALTIFGNAPNIIWQCTAANHTSQQIHLSVAKYKMIIVSYPKLLNQQHLTMLFTYLLD